MKASIIDLDSEHKPKMKFHRRGVQSVMIKEYDQNQNQDYSELQDILAKFAGCEVNDGNDQDPQVVDLELEDDLPANATNQGSTIPNTSSNNSMTQPI